MKGMHLWSIGLLSIFVMIFSAANLMAFENQTIFSDDFRTGTNENWIILSGLWKIHDFTYCQDTCTA